LLVPLTAGGGGPDDRPKPPEPISVRIVPTSFHEKGGRVIALYKPADHFHVVLTNVSDQPIRLWRDWCSWGYFCLSFELTDQDGRTFQVRKKPRGWDKNFPDPFTIPGGNHMVLDVALDDTWEGVPLPVNRNGQVWKIKAVYEVPADEETAKHKVWTGKVSSPEKTYTVFR
jgi:hypothetical protein